ncbi:MAG: ATP-binding protein [Verrucomicrobiae bacterium]|nr:ATP-binding protein [Verrucomicrobiae bacterium]
MSLLAELWRQFPAVLLLGARQVGKTTLARAFLPNAHYCDLEDPQTRDLFETEPRFQIEHRDARPIILDEAQMVPVLFSTLRGIIDQDRKLTGRFLLLGSAQPVLLRQVSETLAGRVGIMDLDPLIASEVFSGRHSVPGGQLWLRGGFPDALKGDFRQWWESYIRTYIERDLPHLGLQIQPVLLRRLMTMLAHYQGCLLNSSQLGAALGVSYHTVQRYLNWMEQTFLVRRLPPYFRNIGKRLTKSPKLYLRDPGLVHHLLNIGALRELDSHPVRGASWEGFVIEEVIRRERLVHPHTQFYFWRTASGEEIDLLLDRGGERIGIEIKAGGSESAGDARKLEAALANADASRGYILDQAAGITRMLPRVTRRNFFADPSWLP